MICPHCEYVHGWNSKDLKSVEGKDGDFYKLPILVEREGFYNSDRRNLYACPSCFKTFVD
jgi:hypothetical protein